MRKIMCGAFISLDGVMQAPGGPDEDPTGGFVHGGWVAPYWSDDLTPVMNETFSRPFDLLLGRKTYDIFAAHWPYMEKEVPDGEFDVLNNDIARTFNRITKYVATHRPQTLTWKNSQSLGDDIAASLRDLKADDGPDLLIQGSSDMIQTLLANDLIDEFRLLIFPLVLGKGKRIFEGNALPAAYRLANSATTANGIIIANYERGGEIATGSFEMETPTQEELERRKQLT